MNIRLETPRSNAFNNFKCEFALLSAEQLQLPFQLP